MGGSLPAVATKARHLKTPTQLWVVDNRKRLGLEPADLAQLTGVSEDTARGWESRGKPSEDALVLLERRFGVPRPKEEASPADQSGIIDAIDRLTAAVARIEDRLDRVAGSTEGLADGLLDLLARLTSEHVNSGAASEPRRVVKS